MSNERNYWQRMRRARQLSRRALLRALRRRAGVGAAGLALVGCGDDDDDGQPQTAARVQAADGSSNSSAMQQASGHAGSNSSRHGHADSAAGARPDRRPDWRSRLISRNRTVADAARRCSSSNRRQAAALRQLTRGGTLQLLDPGRDARLLRPAPRRVRPQPVLDGALHELPDPLAATRRRGSCRVGPRVVAGAARRRRPTSSPSTRAQRWWDRFPDRGWPLDVTARGHPTYNVAAPDRLRWTPTGSRTRRSSRPGRLPARPPALAKCRTSRPFASPRSDGADSTYLGGTILRPFSWFTSPEGIEEFGNRWRDETAERGTLLGLRGLHPARATTPIIGIYLDAQPQLLEDRRRRSVRCPIPDADRVRQPDSTRRRLTPPIAARASTSAASRSPQPAGRRQPDRRLPRPPVRGGRARSASRS